MALLLYPNRITVKLPEELLRNWVMALLYFSRSTSFLVSPQLHAIFAPSISTGYKIEEDFMRGIEGRAEKETQPGRAMIGSLP